MKYVLVTNDLHCKWNSYSYILCRKLCGMWTVRNLPNMKQVWITWNSILVKSAVAIVMLPTTIVHQSDSPDHMVQQKPTSTLDVRWEFCGRRKNLTFISVQLRGYDAYSRTRNFLTRLRDTMLMRSDNFTFNGLSGHREWRSNASILASHSVGPQYISRPPDRLIWLRFNVVFLNYSWDIKN